MTLTSGKTFESAQGASILDTAAQANITFLYGCKTGRCSTCKCKVVAGDTKALVSELGLSEIEKADGWILSRARTAIPVLSQAKVIWQGERGYIQDALLRHISDLRNGVVYACGSDAMIHSAKSTLIAAGFFY